MAKKPNIAAMKRKEARETPRQEKAESKAYQRLETKYGVEKHKKTKKK